MVWDRVKSSDAAMVLGVKNDTIRDIPSSILVSGEKYFSGQSWTGPLIIFEDMPIGNPPPDEDPVTTNVNPHPRPQEQFHHPNQHLLVGPTAFHLIQQHDDNMEQAVGDEGLGHWECPNNNIWLIKSFRLVNSWK